MPRAVRPRRLQGLQRHLRPPGRRCAAHAPRQTFIRRHTVIGERIVAGAPALAQAARLVRSSHERWDGDGYPDRLRAGAIPIGSRIIAVCDAYDAIRSERPYKAGRPANVALAELRRCAGTQFDPAVVDAFCRVLADESPAESPVVVVVAAAG